MKNSDIFEALGALDEKLVMDADELRPAKAKRLNFVRKIAIGVAAMFVLCVATVGTAMAVDEDIRIAVVRSLGMKEIARINEFPNKVKLWLWDELDLQYSNFWSQTWSEEVGIFAGLMRTTNGVDQAYHLIFEPSEIYVVEHTWQGFKITGHAVIEEPEEGELLTLGMVSNKNVTVVYGRTSREFGDIDGDGKSEFRRGRITLSDGSEAYTSYVMAHEHEKNGAMFMSVIYGDHRGATVNEFSFVEERPSEDYPGLLDFEDVATYTELYGELPEIIVSE